MPNFNGAFQTLSAHAAIARTRVVDGQDSRSVDPLVALQNLWMVRTRMDSLQRFLSESLNRNALVSKDQMDTVSNEIVSAIRQIIVNGAALVSNSQCLTSAGAFVSPFTGELPEPRDMAPSKKSRLDCSGTEKVEQMVDVKVEVVDEEELKNDGVDCEDDCEIVELDAMELLAEHIHVCEVCGKGFKRDANLRMHMRAHGNQFKTPEALAKPSDILEDTRRKATRFSCPFEGCNRNKLHEKFRPLKSIVCVKNHFKRSHCPKMYSCNRCHKKNFSVLSDLKSHLKHCGESKWKCSCGTTFSRKDKLFGHIALFEGHMPALSVDEENKGKQVVAKEAEEEKDEDKTLQERGSGVSCLDDGLPDGFFDDLDGFGLIDNIFLQEALGFPSDVTSYGGLPKF